MTKGPAIDEVETWLWDAVERSRGGHERRLRVMSRMTEYEARQWEITYQAKLHRVDESVPPRERGGCARARRG